MKKRSFWNIVWGLLFIAAAGLIILHVLGLTGELNTWSLLLSIPLAAGAIAFAVKMQWLGMFLLLGALTFIHQNYIKPLIGVENDFSFWAIMGIAALFGIGFHMLFGTSRKNKYVGFDADGTRERVSIGHGYEPTVEHADGEKLHFAESFGGSCKYINSEKLSYVSISNKFGGMEIYFDNAKLSPEGAVVDIDNSFGGIELYIPRDWNVINNLSNFAGVSEVTRQKASVEGAPTITICGSNNFGGIEIKLI